MQANRLERPATDKVSMQKLQTFRFGRHDLFSGLCGVRGNVIAQRWGYG